MLRTTVQVSALTEQHEQARAELQSALDASSVELQLALQQLANMSPVTLSINLGMALILVITHIAACVDILLSWVHLDGCQIMQSAGFHDEPTQCDAQQVTVHSSVFRLLLT